MLMSRFRGLLAAGVCGGKKYFALPCNKSLPGTTNLQMCHFVGTARWRSALCQFNGTRKGEAYVAIFTVRFDGADDVRSGGVPDSHWDVFAVWHAFRRLFVVREAGFVVFG